MPETTDRTQVRRIRVLPEQWERIENAARGTSWPPTSATTHTPLFEPRPQIVDNGDGSTAAVWRSAAGRACFRDGEPDGEETIEPRGKSDTVTDPVLGWFDDPACGAMPAAIGYGFPVVARP